MNRLLVFLLALPIIATAEVAPNLLTLKDAVRKGLDFSLEVKKAESAMKAAQDDYRSAEALLFPEISLAASGGTTKSPTSYIPGSVTSANNHSESYSAQLQLAQPLYKGGAVTSGLSSAKLKKDQASQNLFSAKQNYVYSVIDSFYLGAQSQLTLDLAKENRNVLKSYAKITTQYANIGRSKNIDRLQAEANYSLSEAEVLSSESSLQTSLQDLYRLLGSTSETDLRLDTNLALQPVETGNLQQLYEKAVANNPDLRVLQLTAQGVRYDNDVKMSTHYPDLTLNGNYGYASPDRVNWFQKTSETYSLTLNLKIPLFSGLSSLSQSARYGEDLYQAEKNVAIKEHDLQKTLAQALATLTRNFNQLKLTQDSAGAARKAMDRAMRDYRSGLISSTDVLSIQNTRYSAEKQYLSSQYSYQRQILSLRRDLGIDLEKTYVK